MDNRDNKPDYQADYTEEKKDTAFAPENDAADAKEDTVLSVSGELINGVEYAKNAPDAAAKGILKYLSGVLKQYRLSHRPLDTVSDINMPLTIPGMDKTQLRPSLTMMINGGDFPDWIIEVVHPDDAEMTYLMKTGIYAEAGVREYWIVDPEKETILVYQFDKTDFIPRIYDSPQRIRVSIYRDLFISYSDIFRAAK